MNRRQTIPAHLRYTIDDFSRQFPNDEACFEHLREQRFPDGIAYCNECKGERQHHRIKGRPVYACDECLTQISPMAGTIFEHSSTSLRLWYYAMYLMARLVAASRQSRFNVKPEGPTKPLGGCSARFARCCPKQTCTSGVTKAIMRPFPQRSTIPNTGVFSSLSRPRIPESTCRRTSTNIRFGTIEGIKGI